MHHIPWLSENPSLVSFQASGFSDDLALQCTSQALGAVIGRASAGAPGEVQRAPNTGTAKGVRGRGHGKP